MGSFAIGLRIVVAVTVAALAGCGGGGGGGGGGSGLIPITYEGSTTQAALSQTNAKRFLDLIFGTTSSSDVSVLGVAATQDVGIATGADVLRLGARLRGYLQAGKQQAAAARVTAVVIDNTDSCIGGGTVRLTGTLDDATGLGDLTARFESCTDQDGTLTGEVVFRIRGFDLGFLVITDVLIDIKLLRLVDGISDVSVSGTISTQLDIASNTETDTINTVTRDNATGRLSKTEDLRRSFAINQLALTVTGRVYDSLEGFVVISTVNPLTFSSSVSVFPSNGGPLVLSGSGGTSLAIRPISNLQVELQLNNGLGNTIATIGWGSPEEPVFAPPSFTISVTVNGLLGSNLVLRNGSDLLTIGTPFPTTGSTFTFATPVPSGSPYNVTIVAQPTNPSIAETCVVVNGAGIVADANVADIVVNCTRTPFAIGVTVTGLVGSGLVLRLLANSNPGEDLAISSNGSFTFSTPGLSGLTYAIFVVAQPVAPAQVCLVDSGGGIVGKTDVNVSVICGS